MQTNIHSEYMAWHLQSTHLFTRNECYITVGHIWCCIMLFPLLWLKPEPYFMTLCTQHTLSMQDEISSVCRTSFLQWRRLTSIQLYLRKSTSAKLITALITSHLDHCNLVLASLPAKQVSPLQRVQNSASWLLLKKCKWDSITSLVNELQNCP